MPNIKSAKKRVLINSAKAAQNKAQKSALKTQLKKFDVAVSAGDAAAAAGVYADTVKAVDQAAAKGLIHPNNAGRKKSSLARKLNSLNA